MAAARRVVRVSRDVFAQLDEVLGPERGPSGEPSSTDFLILDLLPIVETFATRWDELPSAIPGRDDYRLLISAGVLVRAVAVVGQLGLDGAIELVQVRLDLGL